MRLSPRLIHVLFDVARFRFVSRDQVSRLYFPDVSEKICLNAMEQLQDKTEWSDAKQKDVLKEPGVVARRFAPSINRMGKAGHPMAVYGWLPHNRTYLKRYFAAHNQIEEWTHPRPPFGQSFAQLAEEMPDTGDFQTNELTHHVGVTELLILFEKSVALMPGWELVFCERMHRKSEMNIAIVVEREKLTIEPDIFFCLRSPEGLLRFYVVELENHDTEGKEYNPKLQGFIAYLMNGIWTDYLRRVLATYQLTLTAKVEDMRFTVLTVTRSAYQRDELFRKSIELKRPVMFKFAALPDLSWDKGFEKVWVRAQEFNDLWYKLHSAAPPKGVDPEVWLTEAKELRQRLGTYSREAKREIRDNWERAVIADVPKVSLVE
jgi:hypothetical protein